MPARVAVVIVSYNVAHLLTECLRSLFLSREVDLAVWVVDNASSDDSVMLVQDHFAQVRLIANRDNTGFAHACNQAVREAMAAGDGQPFDHVLLLNPDTVVPPHAIADLVGFLEAHPDAGCVGPKLVRQDGSLDPACRRSFPTPWVSMTRQTGLSLLFPRSRLFGRYNLTYLDPDATYPVDAVVGAFMLVRRQAIEDIGLLDEAFWMYGEDLDWALRMKQAGWAVYYCPEVVVLHYKGESSRRHSDRATREFYRAMLLFYRKHYAASTSPLLGALLEAGIRSKGAVAVWRNRLRPMHRRRVS